MTRQDFFDARIADCQRGFENHIHHARWKTKWKGLITSWLPAHMAAQIWIAHEQATWAGYAQPKGQAAPGGQEK